MRGKYMKAQKWNPKTRKYYNYDLPKGACLCGDDKSNSMC